MSWDPVRDELMAMIEKTDEVCVENTTIIQDLIKWIPESMVIDFIETTRRIYEMYPDPPTDICDEYPEDFDWDEKTEMYFVNLVRMDR